MNLIFRDCLSRFGNHKDLQQKCISAVPGALQIRSTEPVCGCTRYLRRSATTIEQQLLHFANIPKSINWPVNTIVSATLTAALNWTKTVTDTQSVITAISILKVKRHQWLQCYLLFWCLSKWFLHIMFWLCFTPQHNLKPLFPSYKIRE
jgi:hypothetical protein